ncbi:SIMPL domain-containing protein [Porphyrobacter sp. AAP82]|uniref:SIMPL domain-containing protein n=1 Tax=Porphyrobacter sp. AAP82 TaxID=1248917 RepID=UPI00030FF97D|nr:SIMPL domain-containing protein [Porphyrobacter sp. AAP82]
MSKPVTVLAAASALMLPAGAAIAAPQVTLAPAGPVIELSISESVDTAPDRVTIGAGVTSTAPTATAAMRQNAAEMAKVIARIKALGIASEDITTTGVLLGALYDYQNGTPAFRGYQAANRVSILLRKIDDTGSVLDALVEAGATDLTGPEFGIADDTAAKAEARKAAVTRGDAQARAYAAMLGYEGVRVIAVTEAIERSFPVMALAKVSEVAATASPATPIQPGQVTTGVNVTITYELVGKPAAGTK